MKFCTHCGSEINDNAVLCIKCGCSVECKNANNPILHSESKVSASLILGIVGIVFAWLFALVGHIASIVGIILGIKEYRETQKMTGLVLSIIGEACSVFSSIIGAVALSSMF